MSIACDKLEANKWWLDTMILQSILKQCYLMINFTPVISVYKMNALQFVNTCVPFIIYCSLTKAIEEKITTCACENFRSNRSIKKWESITKESFLFITNLRLTICVCNQIVFIANNHQTKITMIETLQDLISHRSAILETKAKKKPN